jgi:competence protein ComEC
LPDTGSASRKCYSHKKWYILAVPFIPVVIYSLLLICGKKDLSVTFLDVGQGDSAVIEFPDGKNMVIDTGKTGRETASFLQYRGWKTLDVLALSHVHPDHTGGLESILKKFQVREICDNGRIVFPDNLSIHPLKRGDVIEGQGYRIYALHPYPEFYTMERGDYVSENNDSLVLKIEGNNLSFLFAGDIEEEAEENILHLGNWVKSTIIKVPHHGGKTSAWGPFFKTASPDIAVISAGRDNSFGHPHQEMLDILQGTRVYRTDIDGAVKISESGKGIDIKTYGQFQLKEAKSWSDEMKNFSLLFETW